MNEFPQATNQPPVQGSTSPNPFISSFTSNVASAAPASQGPATHAEIEKTLQQLEEINRQLSDDEFGEESTFPSPPRPIGEKPNVEVIGSEETFSSETAMQPLQKNPSSNHVSISYHVTASSQLIDSKAGEPTTAPSKINDEELHEFDLAMKGLTVKPTEDASNKSVELNPREMPPLNLDPVSNELVLDVRDFVDSQGTPTPILNAYCGAPDCDSLPDDQAKVNDASPDAFFSDATVSTQEESQEQTFLVGTDEVLTLNGADGFEVIDLKCFDVACAKFTPNQIIINDGNGIHFRIEYRDIGSALFANDCTIDLTKSQ